MKTHYFYVLTFADGWHMDKPVELSRDEFHKMFIELATQYPILAPHCRFGTQTWIQFHTGLDDEPDGIALFTEVVPDAS